MSDNNNRIYLCIDLKSFYASVECVERGLDPMTTNLVVADPTRDTGTICLAVSPSLKALGVSNRCRVFQIPPSIPYIMAPPRMRLYIEYSANIYEIYLKYISKDDIHVYSIDEAFLDVTDYLNLYGMNARQLGSSILNDIRHTLGIVATCGIGTNLYLAKVALDIMAKRSNDFIGYLDEETYRGILWHHKPLTDFWRIGRGISNRLHTMGITTMEDITLADSKLLLKTFGVDAEILIDHAWGREHVTIPQIKAYKSKNHSISSGQVLFHDYTYNEALIIVKEMADLISLDLVDKHLVTSTLSLFIGYSKDILPPSRGTINMSVTTNSVTVITQYFVELYERIANRFTPIRRINLDCVNVLDETFEQYDIFTNPYELERTRKLSTAVLDIKNRYGKNAVLKGLNFEECATTIQRNEQIGGHRSG